MKLNESVEMINSENYQEGFKAEYYQLTNRICELQNMLAAWDNDKLTFEPTCPRSTYDLQLKAMMEYKALLEMRAVMENIHIDTTLQSA